MKVISVNEKPYRNIWKQVSKDNKKEKNMLEPLLLLKDGSDFKRINLRV